MSETVETTYETSESVAKIASALVLAQAEVGGAEKGGKNPHYRNQFSTLENVWAAAKEPLSSNGLAVTQHPVSNNGTPGLRTVLWHSSGEWIASAIYTKPDKPGPQAVGSLITYLRRYSLQSVLGICPEDDDAEGATGKPKPEPVVTLTDDERDAFKADIHFAETARDLRKLGKDIKARGVSGADKDALMTLWTDRMQEIKHEAEAA